MTLATAFSDPRSFRDVYRAHHGFVWHALHRFGLGGAALEDALQDVFVVAYRRQDALTGSTKAWLYAIARRVASNHRRSARRREARVDALADALAQPRAPVPEAILALDRFMAELSPDERELFVLSELEGMTGPEISAAWGMNLNTVYTRVRKLRGALRDAAIAEQAKRERPSATARGWVALAPCLKPATTSGLVVAGWLVAAVTVVSGVTWAAPQMDAPAARTAATVLVEAPLPESHTSEAPPRPTARTTPPQLAAKPKAKPKPRADAHQAPHSTLAQENAMLERARAALQRGRAEEALAGADAHAVRFPQSPLTDVRAILRIEALCALDKAPQARAEATLLLAERPSLTARRRLEKTCAASPRNRQSPDIGGT